MTIRMSRYSISVLLIFFLGGSCCVSLDVQAAAQVQQQGAYTAVPAEDQAMAAELSGKVDKTIKVLTAIKGELDSMKEGEGAAPAAASAASGDAGWVEQMRGRISALIRMWKKTDAIINEGAPSAQSEAQADEAAKSFNQKLDVAIKALEMLKTELAASETEQSSGTDTKK
ncbi:MAG: hypothetical protein PHW14_02800 [Candidatus Omnitrophica bacterium]|nr:hypothetical protein [Candidatus Omnitrophota bacterium]